MPNQESRYSRAERERYYDDPYGEQMLRGRSDDYYAGQRRDYQTRASWQDERSSYPRSRFSESEDWRDSPRRFNAMRDDDYPAADEPYGCDRSPRFYRDEYDRSAMAGQSGGAAYGFARTNPSPGQSQGEHRGKGPKGYTRSDDRIREDVSDALMQDGDLDASDIEVTVKKGEVTLQGQVADRADKRRAEERAEACAGVQDVQNNLKVRARQSEANRAGETRL